MDDWKEGVLKRTLNPPPVAAGRKGSFHTASVLLPGVVEKARLVGDEGVQVQPYWSQVPPAEVTKGSEEGQFTVG
jgi:hypothetical protein